MPAETLVSIEEYLSTSYRPDRDYVDGEDTMRAIMRRTQDYLEMGVPVCWIVEPGDRLAWIADSNGLRDVKDGILRAGDISLPLSDVWPRG